jgi:hypothetical protein
VLKAASQSATTNYQSVQIDCDNLGVVQHGNSAPKPLKEKQAQADVLRLMKHLIISQLFPVDYTWVASHQDDKKKWKHLTLREKMNVIVDKLAKAALITGIAEHIFISSNFPFEQLRFMVGNDKIQGSPKSAISEHWATNAAREFYHSQGILNKFDFNLVFWDGVDAVMAKYPRRFRGYVTKQVSKFCGTNRQLARIDRTGKHKDNCPSCGLPDESSKHITRCRDPGRMEMLAYSVKVLVDWMRTTHVPLDLVQLVEKYILSQDTLSWNDCLPSNCSTMLQTLATTQDMLGWDNFIEGRISKVFLSYVEPSLFSSRRRLSPKRWGIKFIGYVIALTHKQWLFRNSHVHFKKLEHCNRIAGHGVVIQAI